jgi:alkylation response protein AidB-like acyl-CoA dehydrogenase
VQNYGYFQIGLRMCVPTVMAFGGEETKTRFVGPAVRGEEIWCQLFSEPTAGSDVAGIRTRAVRDGCDWVINGQKVWTSGAITAISASCWCVPIRMCPSTKE